MCNLVRTVLPFLVLLAFIHENEAAAPLFLQAITSALGTIPFTAGPMTTGLVGAKLAVGSKLLYYLGFFGRRRSKPSRPKAQSRPKTQSQTGFGNQMGGMQAVPFPYAFGGGFPQQFGGMGSPGFGNAPFGFDQAQLFQMLAAQGIDPLSAMQAMNFNAGGAGGPVPSSPFPFGAAGAGSPPSQSLGGSGGQGGGGMPNQQNQDNQDSSNDDENEVESFFTFLRDMDDNTCISRLMCDIGANPSFLGEFSENIHGIISSLDVKPSSGAYQYIAILKSGQTDKNCAPKFPQCGNAAYEIVKNVAPTVGVPQNINSDMVNKL